jgi:hypothetical protein
MSAHGATLDERKRPESPMITNTFTVTLGACLVATFIGTIPAAAQTTADAIRSTTSEGQKVSITDDQGREFKGRISRLTAGSLSLLGNKTSTDIPYDQIVRIDRSHDGLGNGALIGFGVGAALGLASIAYEDTRSCDPMAFWDCSDPSSGSYAAVSMIFGGLGAAVGVGIDALVHRDPALYRRGTTRISLAPTLGRGKRAAVLSVSW